MLHNCSNDSHLWYISSGMTGSLSDWRNIMRVSAALWMLTAGGEPTGLPVSSHSRTVQHEY